MIVQKQYYNVSTIFKKSGSTSRFSCSGMPLPANAWKDIYEIF
jgi:hypothetical protein